MGIYIYPIEKGKMFRFSPQGNLILKYTTKEIVRTVDEELQLSTTKNTTSADAETYSGLIKIEDAQGNQINSSTIKDLPQKTRDWLMNLKPFQDVSERFEVDFNAPLPNPSKDDQGKTVYTTPSDLSGHTRFFAVFKGK